MHEQTLLDQAATEQSKMVSKTERGEEINTERLSEREIVCMCERERG